jgi:hypothetical protein
MISLLVFIHNSLICVFVMQVNDQMLWVIKQAEIIFVLFSGFQN